VQTPPAPPPPPPPSPLGYAERSSTGALPANLRAVALLVPNVLAVMVLFLPMRGGSAPIDAIVDYVRELIRSGRQPRGSMTWDALVTGPFLLAIPLALWTIRLSIAPRPRVAERAIAWSMTLASLCMTMLCIGYCIVLDAYRFWPAAGAAIVVLALASIAVAMLWRLRNAWPTALLAMTGAWAANTTLTMFVVLSRTPLQFGAAMGLSVVVLQIAIGAICVRRWHAATATAGITPG